MSWNVGDKPDVDGEYIITILGYKNKPQWVCSNYHDGKWLCRNGFGTYDNVQAWMTYEYANSHHFTAWNPDPDMRWNKGNTPPTSGEYLVTVRFIANGTYVHTETDYWNADEQTWYDDEAMTKPSKDEIFAWTKNADMWLCPYTGGEG